MNYTVPFAQLNRGSILAAGGKGANLGEKEVELVGDPIAPGVIRCIANVLHEPYEKPLNKGEILVTRATDPSWTPLSMNADGVVLEVCIRQARIAAVDHEKSRHFGECCEKSIVKNRVSGS